MKQSFYKTNLHPLRELEGFSLRWTSGLLGALLWLFPMWLSAQTEGKNYILTTVPYQEVSSPLLLTDGNSNTSIQYFDGLGRLIQTVQRGISNNGADLVAGVEYDSYSREWKKYLPGMSDGNNGLFVDNYSTKSAASNNDSRPYTTTEYEPSPLSRVTGQYGAGADWYSAGKKQTIEYLINDANIAYYYVNSDKHLAKGAANYEAGSLYATKVMDEDTKTGYEFKDKLGRVILKRQILDGGNVDTYYVYNDLSQLCYVLPPKAVDELTADLSDGNAIIKQYCYLYKYEDNRGNCTYKRLPGCEPILMVYDRADRLILSQDGNQRAKTPVQWTVNKYDQLGRVIFTGLTNSITANQTNLISTYQNDLIVEIFNSGAYTNNKYPDATPLTINYYDTYSFIPAGSTLTYNSSLDQTYSAQYGNAKGLLTGTQVYQLDNPVLSETTAIYYDKYGRVVQSRASNHLGGYDIMYNKLDFTGKPTMSYKTHSINGTTPTVTELYTYVYNKAQQPTTTTYSLNSGTPVTLVANTYDELGRVSVKTLGGVDATTYTYNVRSWVKDISGNRFSENLYYNTGPTGLPSFNASYNGNIAGMQWSVPSENLGHNRAYNFVYDNLNRLTNANYCEFNGSVVSGTSGRYDETFGFDKMGNINALTRKENGDPIENLSFTYNGNQLNNVNNTITPAPFIPYGSEAFKDSINTGIEYTYDKNGSTISDLNTGIKYYSI